MTVFRITVPWSQRLSMKNKISLLLKDATDFFFRSINSMDSREFNEGNLQVGLLILCVLSDQWKNTV